jgi:iron complex transport system substrate-binding protein
MSHGMVGARSCTKSTTPRISLFAHAGRSEAKTACLTARPGFDTVPAVRNGRLYEIKSALILQPGPAALTDGLKALESIIANAPAA